MNEEFIDNQIEAEKEATTVANTFKFNSKIVGSTFIPGGQEALKALSIGQALFLVREPDNEFDQNAIAVHAQYILEDSTFEQIRIGYLPKETAAKLCKDVEQFMVTCNVAEITGGTTDKSNTGCNILLIVERKDEKN